MIESPTLPAWCRIVREPLASYERGAFAERPAARGPRDMYALLGPRLEREEVEVFVVLCLDTQHHVIAMQEVSRGLVHHTLVAPREVFRLAIAMGATYVVVAHNHPSGDPTPSPDDRLMTEQLAAAGRVLDIPMQDHLIVGCGRYVSFAEAGLF